MSEIERGPSSTQSLSQKTILVVDDDREILDLVSNYLCSLGYTVLAAKSGPEAINVAESHFGAIDLLLVDVEMPGMIGVEFAKYFLSRRSDVSVIFMSGFGDSQEFASLPGTVEFLPKPFSLSELGGKTIRLISVNTGCR
jgi:two-component system cell cycle sensor histidine kinase/response regulator CckA